MAKFVCVSVYMCMCERAEWKSHNISQRQKKTQWLG